MERYVAFDVETPNCRNDRMSALGVAVVEAGEIVQQFDTVINPECVFDPFNIALTGITPAMTMQAPTFPQVWCAVEHIFSRGILVAHNAPFDMSVLSRCLRDYGIEWRDQTEYLCTCRTGRSLLPDLKNHKLDTLCGRFGIELDHHRAGSDASACAGLLLEYERMGADLRRFQRTYDLVHGCTLKACKKKETE